MDHLHFAVCDDDVLLSKAIANIIQKTFLKFNIEARSTVFNSVNELRDLLASEKLPLLFLDIDMPETDGITFAKELRANKINTSVVFISSLEEKVFDCFEVHPFSFIRKTTFIQDIPDVVKRFLKEFHDYSLQKLTINNPERVVTFNINNIVYIESESKYQCFHLADSTEPVRVRCTMNDLEEELIKKGFLRAHRAFLVNSRYIKRIESKTVYTSTNAAIPLGRTKADEFYKAYVSMMI